MNTESGDAQLALGEPGAKQPEAEPEATTAPTALVVEADPSATPAAAAQTEQAETAEAAPAAATTDDATTDEVALAPATADQPQAAAVTEQSSSDGEAVVALASAEGGEAPVLVTKSAEAEVERSGPARAGKKRQVNWRWVNWFRKILEEWRRNNPTTTTTAPGVTDPDTSDTTVSGTDPTDPSTDTSGTTPTTEVGTSPTKPETSPDATTDVPETTATTTGSTSETTGSTTATTTATTEATTAPTATTAPPTNETLPTVPVSGNTVFFEDFSSNNSLSRFDFDIYHRDDSLVRVTNWPADHQPTGPNDLCGAPEDKRTIQRGERNTDFNNDWIYRCVPGGDLEKAHIMTSIGHTSGYSIGAFTPKQTFNNIREIRWDVNQTDLGARQWTELVLIPENNFNFQNLPCVTGLPCNTVTHTDIGSVGTHWAGTRARNITTPAQPSGYTETSGPRGYRFPGSSRENSMRFGEDYGTGDPALTSIRIRRTNYFRDNGNGTLSWGYQLDNGTYQEMTVPGAFPTGNFKIVFKDHNYTPLKSPSTLLPETHFTWHWDNIHILR